MAVPVSARALGVESDGAGAGRNRLDEGSETGCISNYLGCAFCRMSQRGEAVRHWILDIGHVANGIHKFGSG